MSFHWLKSYMPRSLYGRAVLILLLPVITLLLVVSVVFVQRHFEGVTRQMVTSVGREVQLLINDPRADAAQINASEAAQMLQIAARDVSVADVPRRDQRRWLDLSGGVVVRAFHQVLPQTLAVALPDDRQVRLYLDRPTGPLELSFDRRRASASNPHQFFVNMLFFGIVMTLISYIYLRNQLKPITRLARAAEAFGRGRPLDFAPSGASEIRAAGSAFLNMRARIERQIEQRTLLLSGVSHDLRTPLTRLKLGLSMLEDDDADPMRRDVDEMERLLNEFLEFVRDASEGDPEPLDPIALVTQIVADFQRSDAPVSLVLTEGTGTLPLREAGIRRAVENLIGNALRYGEKAEISVLLSEKSLRIRVEDAGPGIPEERREEAMRPFTRLEPARNQNRGSGVGLGLSIALDIARAHGGVLRLGESQRLGGLQADIVLGR